MITKILLIILFIIILLLGLTLIKTLLVPKPRKHTEKEIPINTERAVEYGRSLSELIKIETISSKDDKSRDKFFTFHKELENQFPLIHEKCEKMVFNGSLLYKWPGNNKAEPIMLMSHHDVVEAPGKWTFPPFGGKIANGVLWGRGTVDTKSNLFCFLTAVEELLKNAFVPNGDIYLASTCTEEWSGEGGELIANYFKENNIKLEMILDEGGMIVDEPIKGVPGKFAMIGVMEKGMGNLKFIAKGLGGHASAPPKNSPIARLAAFINHVEKSDPFKAKFNSTVSEMYRRLLPNMKFPMKYIFSNLWIFEPILKKLMPSISSVGTAMLKTTCAFTTQKGSIGLNVLPQEAYVTANMRFIPHQGTEESIEIISNLAKKYNIETEIINKSYPCPVVNYNSKPFKLVEDTVKKIYPNVSCSPYVMSGATDCKFFSEVCENSIRFAPLEISPSQIDSVHGLDENINISTLVTGVDFFKSIIKNWC
ncbi:carboxypeptidase PM20D1 [Clostridium punense]|uniref:Carboxypeptidase PM20D1 n=2 Tax=Clostridium TaxID=1485 RepID=A0ABS4KCA8_9CLOT|nr:M20/M25/M40 family metallo-hydrolase [Clostridium punense]MBP2024259.1 carboxypeptidase PM20D1 [Clostridium punense]